MCHILVKIGAIKHICQCTQVGRITSLSLHLTLADLSTLSPSVYTPLRSRVNTSSDAIFSTTSKSLFFTKIATPHPELSHLHETVSLIPLLHTTLSTQPQVPNSQAKDMFKVREMPTCCCCLSLFCDRNRALTVNGL